MAEFRFDIRGVQKPQKNCKCEDCNMRAALHAMWRGRSLNMMLRQEREGIPAALKYIRALLEHFDEGSDSGVDSEGGPDTGDPREHEV
jgi:hypothetical protein